MEPRDYKEEEYFILFPTRTLKKWPNLIHINDQRMVLSSEFLTLPDIPILQPESASLVIDNKTGGVVAFTGGIDVDNPARLRFNQLNSLRQPGQALVPLSAYYPAFVDGDTLASSYDDTPQLIDGVPWPGGRDFRGYCLLYSALLQQRNAVSGRLLQKHGFNLSVNELDHLGIGEDVLVSSEENPQRNDYTLDALASGNLTEGVDLKKLSFAYAQISSKGHTPPLHFVYRIENSQGKVLFSEEDLTPSDRIQDQAAQLVQYTLSHSAFAENTATEDFSVLGSNKFLSDYWMIAGNADYTAATWVGNQSQKLSLSRDPDSIENFFRKIYEPWTSENTLLPSHWAYKTVSSKTGLLATNAVYQSNTAITLPFFPGTEPSKYSENYIRKLICTVSGELATQFCPDDTVESRYYFTRNDNYDPSAMGDIYPDDYYAGPTSYCSIHTREWYEEQQKEQDTENNPSKTTIKE